MREGHRRWDVYGEIAHLHVRAVVARRLDERTHVLLVEELVEWVVVTVTAEGGQVQMDLAEPGGVHLTRGTTGGGGSRRAQWHGV